MVVTYDSREVLKELRRFLKKVKTLEGEKKEVEIAKLKENIAELKANNDLFELLNLSTAEYEQLKLLTGDTSLDELNNRWER